MLRFFTGEREMKGRIVIAADKEGKEYRYPSILAAAKDLNLSMTTIKTRAGRDQPIASAQGTVVIRFDNQQDFAKNKSGVNISAWTT